MGVKAQSPDYPSAAQALTYSSRGDFNKFSPPGLGVHDRVVRAAPLFPKGCSARWEYEEKYLMQQLQFHPKCWLSGGGGKATSPGHATKCIKTKGAT